MASLNVTLSGGWRVSSTSDVIVRSLSSVVTCSTFFQQEIVLLPTVSEYLISMSLFSAPNLLLMTSTNTVRVNFGGQASSVSAASASVIQFKDAFFMVGSSVGGGLPSSIHLSNSGADSATVTVLVGQ